ncbi:hypothetical protein NK326_24015, partial [Salmonella enterica]|nr:hypothetical protein [Salmonella enterica]
VCRLQSDSLRIFIETSYTHARIGGDITIDSKKLGVVYSDITIRIGGDITIDSKKLLSYSPPQLLSYRDLQVVVEFLSHSPNQYVST